MVFDSSKNEIQMIAKGKSLNSLEISETKKWDLIKNNFNE